LLLWFLRNAEPPGRRANQNLNDALHAFDQMTHVEIDEQSNWFAGEPQI
jgi:hypothetical protein